MKKIFFFVILFISIQLQAQKMWRFDPSFNGNGRVLSKGKVWCMFGYKTAFQSDGKIIVAGTESEYRGDFKLGVSRFLTDGTYDESFGNQVSVATYNGLSRANCVYVLKDDKILVAGLKTVVKFTKNGALDNSFDKDGVLDIPFPTGTVAVNINKIAVQPDGKILVGGYYKTNIYYMLMVRLNSNGSIDSSFGANGYVYAKVANLSAKEKVEDMLLLSDGKILVASTNDNDALVVKFKSNGELDSTFGSKGTAVAKICPYEDGFAALAVQKDGKIIAGGWANTGGTNSDMALSRLTAAGKVDATFGKNGYVVLDITGNPDGISTVIVDSSDGIWITGTAHTGLYRDMFAAKYDKNGILDTVNLKTGKFIYNMLGTVPRDDISSDIAFDPKGNILITGTTETNSIDYGYFIALVRLYYTDDTSSNVGIFDNIEIKKLHVFPNPAANYINVEFASPLKQEFCIYNILGELVYTELWQKGETQKSINVASLNKGIYIIRVGDVVKKIVKE